MISAEAFRCVLTAAGDNLGRRHRDPRQHRRCNPERDHERPRGRCDHGVPREQQSRVEIPVEVVQTEPAKGDTFQQLMANQPSDAVDTMIFAIGGQMDKRAEFEKVKKPDNENIQTTLKKARAEVVTKACARVLLAANVDPAFINRTLHDGSCYNVYAIGKIADLIKAISADDGKLKNAINNAITRSLFACRAAGVTFPGEVARAAASDKIHIDANIRKHLVRHTVSASTGPTQASSTMQALATLGVVKTSGSSAEPSRRDPRRGALLGSVSRNFPPVASTSLLSQNQGSPSRCRFSFG